MTGPDYPHESGDVVVIGPEAFIARDGSVLCYRGRNYVPQPPPDSARGEDHEAVPFPTNNICADGSAPCPECGQCDPSPVDDTERLREALESIARDDPGWAGITARNALSVDPGKPEEPTEGNHGSGTLPYHPS